MRSGHGYSSFFELGFVWTYARTPAQKKQLRLTIAADSLLSMLMSILMRFRGMFLQTFDIVFGVGDLFAISFDLLCQ